MGEVMGGSCSGEALGWETGALAPGGALPCVTQDKLTPWGGSSSVEGGVWAGLLKGPSQL